LRPREGAEFCRRRLSDFTLRVSTDQLLSPARRHKYPPPPLPLYLLPSFLLLSYKATHILRAPHSTFFAFLHTLPRHPFFLSLLSLPHSDGTKMSDHESNHSSDREQDNTVDPFMVEALEIVDSQARAERSSATPLPAEAITTSPSAIPIGTTQNRSSYNWPQPRARASPATETVDPGIRRTPAGIRALSESRQSSMCTLQSGATNRIRANIFKGASAAASSPPARFIHEHHDGGSLRPGALRPKSRKMKWTAENDRTLLLVGFGRDIPGLEFQTIADYFKEKPTAKAVQERLTKLRAAQRKVLKDSGIYDADASPPPLAHLLSPRRRLPLTDPRGLPLPPLPPPLSLLVSPLPLLAVALLVAARAPRDRRQDACRRSPLSPVQAWLAAWMLCAGTCLPARRCRHSTTLAPVVVSAANPPRPSRVCQLWSSSRSCCAPTAGSTCCPPPQAHHSSLSVTLLALPSPTGAEPPGRLMRMTVRGWTSSGAQR
jgi:hypothetical protein